MKRILALLFCLIFVFPTTLCVYAQGEAETHDCEIDGHVMGDWEVVTTANCENDGIVKRVCNFCSYEETDTIPATGHSWSAWKTISYPSYSAQGEQRRTCANCNTVQIKKLEMMAFTDVKKDKWYTDAVIFCADNGYMAGVKETYFSLSGQITRAQMVVIMAAVAGKKNDASQYKSYNTFTDVKSGSWYHDAVEWAYAGGLCSGTGAGKFTPDKYATREEVAVFLTALAKYMGKNTTATQSIASYSDSSSVHSWAYAAMSFCVGNGIIKPVTSKALCPRIYTTRANMALMIKNFVNFVK